MKQRQKRHIKHIVTGYVYGIAIYFAILIAILYLMGYGNNLIETLTTGNTSNIFYATLIAGFLSFVVTEELWFNKVRRR